MYYIIRLLLVFSLTCNCLLANTQSTISATYSNEIPTNYNVMPFGYDNSCNGSGTQLSVTLPPNNAYKVTSVSVTYSMTAIGSGDQLDQFSVLKFVNSNITESMEATNNIPSPGTNTYTRTINIANGLYPGGQVLVFQLMARRIFEGIPGCNSLVNKVDAGSWTITVSFTENGGVGIGITTNLKGKLDVRGVAGSGTTVAAFGTHGAGISVQRGPPAIGFNQYRDSSIPGSNGRYMSDGSASLLNFDTNTGTISIDMFPFGEKDTETSNVKRGITFLNNGNVGIKNFGSTTSSLSVSKDLGNTSSMVAKGMNHESKFNYLASENTHIDSDTLGAVYFNLYENMNQNSDIGKTILPCNTRIGTGGSTNPLTSVDLFGSLGFNKEILEIGSNCSTSTEICVPKSSFMTIHKDCISNPTTTEVTLMIADGIAEGQILLIQSDHFYNDDKLIINEGPNMDLSSNHIMNNKDTLLLIWRKVSSTTKRWTEISFKNNE